MRRALVAPAVAARRRAGLRAPGENPHRLQSVLIIRIAELIALAALAAAVWAVVRTARESLRGRRRRR